MKKYMVLYGVMTSFSKYESTIVMDDEALMRFTDDDGFVSPDKLGDHLKVLLESEALHGRVQVMGISELPRIVSVVRHSKG